MFESFEGSESKIAPALTESNPKPKMDRWISLKNLGFEWRWWEKLEKGFFSKEMKDEKVDGWGMRELKGVWFQPIILFDTSSKEEKTKKQKTDGWMMKGVL